ncbi:uncharacterized protein EKO05_0001090 [Ascochyta rabiei]|uniref:Uncharacterized protein n=1 Tax=Didymella rabiei TaxID=5454 RepID=A0A162YR94_DIDRA|nr:uncharacterized protein EKO05_0001090 [Ascochyta rabiei]KZM20181.1 hypothetical protein ST47_g8639 [Ascochyta rabiei]UPX10429.1 hypothetical protein EKO05_0001090 [Ascochyta rabiei]
MRQSIAILTFLASAALADDVLSFIFPGGYDGVAPVATVESVNPSTTSALVTCPTGTAADECGWGNGLNVQIISGTRYEAVMSAASLYVSYGCDYNSVATQMTCTAETSDQDAQTAILSGSDVAFITASVVEGAEKLSGASATGSASASASASASGSAAPTSSGSAAASSALRTSIASASGTAAAGSHASGPPSATASSSAPQSTGAAARFGIEGTALLALAGAAALNVL